jgi:hypothetical protein
MQYWQKGEGGWLCLPLSLAYRLYCDSLRVATYRKPKPTVETSCHSISTLLPTEAPDVNNMNCYTHERLHLFITDEQAMNQLNYWIIVQLMTIRPSSWLIKGLTDWQKKLLSDGQTELVTKKVQREIHSTDQRQYSIKCNKTQIIKDNSWQVSNSYMFRHRTAILRESTRTK